MLRTRVAATILAGAAALVAASPPALASPVGYTRATIAGNDNIYTVDLATGAMTLVGDSGLDPASRALSMHPDGTLYGARNGSLYTYNTVTGVASVVGPFDCCGIVQDMTFDGDGNLWLLSSNPSRLFSVNVGTGAATEVGPLNRGLMTGLAVDCDGTMFGTDGATDTLVTIDPTTAAATTVGTFGFDVGSGSLAFDASGTLWMLVRPAAPAGAPSRTMTVNTATGVLSEVAGAVAGNNPSDLALAPPSCPSDPGPTIAAPESPSDPTTPTTPGTPTTPARPTTPATPTTISSPSMSVTVRPTAVLVTPTFTG